MRLFFGIVAAILSVCLTSLEAAGSGLDVGHACRNYDMKCLSACRQARKTGETLSIWEREACDVVTSQLESKSLGGRACNTTSCIVRLNLVQSSETEHWGRYTGHGFSVLITNETAAISSPGGGVTQLYRECGEADGHCGDWRRQSGPLTRANITYANSFKEIILEIPK